VRGSFSHRKDIRKDIHRDLRKDIKSLGVQRGQFLVMAGVGIAVALDQYLVAVVATLIIVLVNRALWQVDVRLHGHP